MKKFITTLLAVLYICTSTGATLQLHYCMGELADVAIGHQKDDRCGQCGMKKGTGSENSCCKDVHKFIKNDTDQKFASAGLQLLQLLAAALPPSSPGFPCNTVSQLSINNPIKPAPIIADGLAVYIRNCVFLL